MGNEIYAAFYWLSRSEQIKQAHAWGFVGWRDDNPSLAAKVGKSYKKLLMKSCDRFRPVSLETNCHWLWRHAERSTSTCEIKDNVYAKIPCTVEGFAATNSLRQKELRLIWRCVSASIRLSWQPKQEPPISHVFWDGWMMFWMGGTGIWAASELCMILMNFQTKSSRVDPRCSTRRHSRRTRRWYRDSSFSRFLKRSQTSIDRCRA